MNMEAYWKAVRAFREKILNSGKSWWEIAADLYNSDNESIIKNGFVQLFGLDHMIVTSVGDGAYNGAVENNKVGFQGYSYQRISEHLTENFGFIFKPLEGCSNNVMHAESHGISIVITIGGGYLRRVWVSFNMSKIEKDKTKVFRYVDPEEEAELKNKPKEDGWRDPRYDCMGRWIPTEVRERIAREERIRREINDEDRERYEALREWQEATRDYDDNGNPRW